jgi:hypothetical protein
VSEIAATRTFECDLCGTVWTTEERADTQLADGLGQFMDITTDYIGRAPTYCPDCVATVREARDAAIAARRALKGEPSGIKAWRWPGGR